MTNSITQKVKLPFWATVFTLIGLIILCSLGTWQLQRLEWKNDLIAKLDAAYVNEKTASSELEKEGLHYITIQGKPLWDKTFPYGYAIQNETPGHYVVTPIDTGSEIWLAHLGWVSKNTNLEMPSLNRLTLKGLAREVSWNIFTPQNQPDKNLWYRLDVEEIQKTYNFPILSPLVLFAEDSTPALPENLPNNTRFHPKNDHLQYAFFWFTMALGLAAVYIFRFVIKKNENK